MAGCCLKLFGVLPLCCGCGFISIVRAVCSPVSADFQVSAFCQPHCLLRSKAVFLIKGITATIEIINENCIFLVAAGPIGFPIVYLVDPRGFTFISSLLPTLCPISVLVFWV